MSVWWVALIVGATTFSGLIAKWMVLRFLHRVYERGGAQDLKIAAEALRRTRSWTVAEKLTRGRNAIPRSRDQGEE
ncbi:hypothetical protein [Kibdelosporangium aridum]|uniref:Uncharacterized protein n=1 Tax=Kibdelosporangium aridum TaxID=2030 RepID=A0A1Y5XCS4_KIBAR|nr:hypothetical protein [Kibdelosporangium aridum]SMC86449.1 hypothetical protein SAMN05661093_02355 [Kibdelosporangium aridum]